MDTQQCIAQLIQQRRLSFPHTKVFSMSGKLERLLYAEATSFDEYNDRRTLKTRMRSLAIRLSESHCHDASMETTFSSLSSPMRPPATPSNSTALPSGHRVRVVKQQQQRLLLLRHASKCPHDQGTCPVTAHCAQMKQLWQHIISCRVLECKVQHCVSSRYVLSHYSKCHSRTCVLCGPVRAAVTRQVNRQFQRIPVRLGAPMTLDNSNE